MWFSRLKRTISHASGGSLRRNVLAHCTPPNPPPTITTRFGVVVITPAAYSKNHAMSRINGTSRVLLRKAGETSR
jgi:hypothetical protein